MMICYDVCDLMPRYITYALQFPNEIFEGDELRGALGGPQLLPARPAGPRCLAWHLLAPPACAAGAAEAHAAEAWGSGPGPLRIDVRHVIHQLYGLMNIDDPW